MGLDRWVRTHDDKEKEYLGYYILIYNHRQRGRRKEEGKEGGRARGRVRKQETLSSAGVF